MKKSIKKAAFLAAAALTFFGCREHQMIEIPPLGPGSTTSARKVLIEEFTGARCPNCPAGSAAIEDLIALNPANLIAVSIHAGGFSEPLPDSKYDFRTPEGTAIETYVGKPLGYPSAVVDRKQFAGDNDLQAFKGQWAGRIKEQIDLNPPKLAVAVARNYDPATRRLELTTTLVPTEKIDGDLRLSIMLTESGIVDYQDDQGVKIPDYVHKHVLRTMLTPFDGQVLGASAASGVPIERAFSFTVPAEWKAEKCKIVAFAHFGGQPSKEILQAEETSIID